MKGHYELGIVQSIHVRLYQQSAHADQKEGNLINKQSMCVLL